MFDFTSIKDILKKERSKIIIVEEGQPSYVLLPIEEYRILVGRTDLSAVPLEQETIEQGTVVINDEVPDKESGGATAPPETLYLEGWHKSHNIQLEDLPF